jgi:Fe-S-cluster containining protein
MCGKCCKELGHGLTIVSEDYRRWKRQRRTDILSYVWIPEGSNGYGDIWIDPRTAEDLDHCPFLTKIGRGKYVCGIHDTKPKVCKEFWCEWAYGAGKKGIPFKSMNGWGEKAKQLGYMEPRVNEPRIDTPNSTYSCLSGQGLQILHANII